MKRTQTDKPRSAAPELYVIAHNVDYIGGIKYALHRCIIYSSHRAIGLLPKSNCKVKQFSTVKCAKILPHLKAMP